MSKEKYTTIKVNHETKEDLNKLKLSKESYNDVIIRLIQENNQLKEILLNVEKLQNHLQNKNE